MKILIVDDEQDVEILFKQKFRKELRNKEYELEFAFSAECAIEILNKKGHSDIILILSDINMPGMNGLELLKYIKTNLPHLKVFMLTAYNDEKNFRQAQEFGADNYITKPLNFDEIKKSIEEFKLTQKNVSGNS